MTIEELTSHIAKFDKLEANAVRHMCEYIQDKWAGPYPSKEQTEAVNAYLNSIIEDDPKFS